MDLQKEASQIQILLSRKAFKQGKVRLRPFSNNLGKSKVSIPPRRYKLPIPTALSKTSSKRAKSTKTRTVSKNHSSSKVSKYATELSREQKVEKLKKLLSKNTLLLHKIIYAKSLGSALKVLQEKSSNSNDKRPTQIVNAKPLNPESSQEDKMKNLKDDDWNDWHKNNATRDYTLTRIVDFNKPS